MEPSGEKSAVWSASMKSPSLNLEHCKITAKEGKGQSTSGAYTKSYVLSVQFIVPIDEQVEPETSLGS